MTTKWGRLVVDGTVQQFVGITPKVCKYFVQLAPGATGQVKIGPANVALASTSSGTVIDSTATTNADTTKQAGGSWSVETHDVNTISTAQYFFIGSHTGDVLMYETHEN